MEISVDVEIYLWYSFLFYASLQKYRLRTNGGGLLAWMRKNKGKKEIKRK